MSSKSQSFLKEEFHSKHIRAVFSSEFLLKFHFKEKFTHFNGSVGSVAAMMCSRYWLLAGFFVQLYSVLSWRWKRWWGRLASTWQPFTMPKQCKKTSEWIRNKRNVWFLTARGWESRIHRCLTVILHLCNCIAKCNSTTGKEMRLVSCCGVGFREETSLGSRFLCHTLLMWHIALQIPCFFPLPGDILSEETLPCSKNFRVGLVWKTQLFLWNIALGKWILVHFTVSMESPCPWSWRLVCVCDILASKHSDMGHRNSWCPPLDFGFCPRAVLCISKACGLFLSILLKCCRRSAGIHFVSVPFCFCGCKVELSHAIWIRTQVHEVFEVLAVVL